MSCQAFDITLDWRARRVVLGLQGRGGVEGVFEAFDTTLDGGARWVVLGLQGRGGVFEANTDIGYVVVQRNALLGYISVSANVTCAYSGSD